MVHEFAQVADALGIKDALKAKNAPMTTKNATERFASAVAAARAQEKTKTMKMKTRSSSSPPPPQTHHL